MAAEVHKWNRWEPLLRVCTLIGFLQGGPEIPYFCSRRRARVTLRVNACARRAFIPAQPTLCLVKMDPSFVLRATNLF